MTRKVTRIALAGHENTSSTQFSLTLIALCDDGTIWSTAHSDTIYGVDTERGQNGWYQANAIPETVADKPTDEVLHLKRIIKHCWVHSGYVNCGRAKMGSALGQMFDKIVEELSEKF